MPRPRKGETQKKYLSRAIPEIKKHGVRGHSVSQRQSIAIAYSMFRERKRKAGKRKKAR